MSKSALMVIDVQKDVVANGFETERVVSNINSLISKARAAHVPVIWVQHSDDYLVKGSEGWNFVDELEPLDSDSRIYKTQPSSFEGTNLLDLLNVLGTNELVITGAQTDFCVNEKQLIQGNRPRRANLRDFILEIHYDKTDFIEDISLVPKRS